MKNILIVLTIIFYPLVGSAQTTLETLKKVKAELLKMSEEDAYKQGLIGFSLRTKGGEEVVRLNASKVLIPASNMKVLTTGTALRVLGSDFKYETKIYYTGKINNGILEGNIIIKGSGDPSLGSDRIPGNLSSTELSRLFAEKIKAAGINKVNGRILQDYFCFDKNPVPDGWIWTDIGNYYGAGVHGINFNENLFEMNFRPGKKAGDSTTVISTKPVIGNLQIDNQVLTGPFGSGDNAWIFGAPYSPYRFVRGTIPAGVNEFTIKGSMPDPPLQLVTSIYDNLTILGVEVTQPAMPSQKLQSTSYLLNSADTSLLYVHSSPKLSELVKYTNLFSLNLYAEAIYRSLKNKLPTSEEAITSYWKSQGIITEGNFIYDGSGLSPQNGVKPSFVTLLLFEMSKDISSNVFYTSLPTAGESGTLSRFCKGTKAEGKVHAKSGSMDKVLGYSGYIKGKSGNEYSFSILVNSFTGKTSLTSKRIEKIMNLLIEL